MIRIAVCEDDYVYIEMIQSILQSCITVPYEVKFFSSGTEFLNTLTGHGCPYTLVITDSDLGSQSVNGITVAKRINKMNGDTQIIFVSQYLEFASDVYETSHLYFVNKKKLLEYLPKALTAAHEKSAVTSFFIFSHPTKNTRLLRTIFSIWSISPAGLVSIPPHRFIHPVKSYRIF